METPRNYDPKWPLVLILDVSGSMSGAPIDALNKALISFKDEIIKDTILSNRLELAIVAFHDQAEVVRDFDLVQPKTNMPVLEAEGITNMFDGINKAIEIIEDRKQYYKKSEQRYYQPIIVLISDGTPTNTEQQIDDLDQKIQSMSDDKKFRFIPFGVGEGADMQILAKLAHVSGDRDPVAYKLKDETKFIELFVFVENVANEAHSGDISNVTLDPDVATAHIFSIDLEL